jgi:putative ABC transport system ATP-binding protein
LTPIIRTEEISRQFRLGKNLIDALKNATLSIATAEFALLEGPSGSGKTTLINLMGALDYPTAGEIFFDDNNITRLSEVQRDELRRRKMGFVFQSIALISHMSAYENVEFALRIAGYEARGRQTRAEECLALVGLRARMHHRPHELSGGEQQRVAIARAIAHRPKVLFADEPTGELDTHMGLQVIKIFKSLVAEENITVVMSSHDPNVIDLADNVFTLSDGEIVHAS